LGIGRANDAELGGGDGQGCGAEETAAMMVDPFGNVGLIHGKPSTCWIVDLPAKRRAHRAVFFQFD
jgi:hypothetical protein